MKHEPQIQQRPAQPYVGIRMWVTMDGFPAAVDTGFPEIFGWLAKHGVALAGPPFIRYHVTGDEFEIELAVPIDAAVTGDGRVHSGAFPAGRYLTLRHAGPFDGLAASHAGLQRWAREHGMVLDRWDTGRGAAWRSCSEQYLVDPSTEPDPSKWETELAYLVTER